MNRILQRLSTSLKHSSQKSHLLCLNRNLAGESSSQAGTEKPEQMDQMKSNPYFEKYKNKLKAVYDENPEKFLDSLANKKVEKIGNPEDYGIDVTGKTKFTMSRSMTKKRTLDSIMNIDQVKDLQPEAIRAIWITFLSEIKKFPGMINENEFEIVANRSSKFTTFILPLPREQGYEFMLLQWAGHECHLTPLISYQAHGAEAPSILTMVYFDEFLSSKKIALEMVEIDANQLKPEEAQYLIHLVKQYYINSKEGDEKYSLLKSFTNEPDKFSHMSVIDMIKSDKLTVDQFKQIKDIEKETEGILERVQKAPVSPVKEVKEDRYKEKDLADFS